jgi:hypothetical protein
MSDLAGHNLGPYRIIEQLGMGGMATVYKAYQPSMDRYVAIKVLPRHFAQDPTFTGRFEQEAKTIAKLEHARILPVYDYGEEDGITYIVMRLLDAGTLSELIAQGPVSLEETARIIGQIAEGLDYAHSKGVLHRDVKPSNIMLDSSGNVYITDFGITKLVEGTAQFTATGGLVGTPAYVSPEQGMGQPVDHRSDIYSLGVVLYEMVTGRTPFQAETPMAVVIKHINDPLPLPRSINPDLPETVERVILKTLAKHRDERYQSCGEMAADLQQMVAEAMDPHLRPTDLASPTAILTAPPAAPTDTAPSPIGDDAGAGTLPLIQPAPAPRKKAGWLLPLAIVGGLVGLVALGAIVVLLVLPMLQAEEPPAVAETEPPPPVEQVPAAEEPLPPTEKAPPPLEVAVGCAPDQTTVMLQDFKPGTDIFALPPGSEIVQTGDGKYALQVSAVENPVHVPFGPEMADSTLMVLALVPPEQPQTGLSLYSRLGEDGQSYMVVFEPGGMVRLHRNGEPVARADIDAIQLADGRLHTLALHTEKQRIEVRADGKMLLEWGDEIPLPPGKFALEVASGTAQIGAVWICGYGEQVTGGEPGQKPLFADNFEAPDLDVDMWGWINEPVGEWTLADGRLLIPVLPGTGTGAGGMPILALKNIKIEEGSTTSVQVEVNVLPAANYQAAGLVVLNQRREPLLTLTRAFCDTANTCQGDAIYFDNWLQFMQNQTEYRAYQAGAGQLPPGKPVWLRLVHQRNVVSAYYRLSGEGEWLEVGHWPVIEMQLSAVGIGTSSGGQPTEAIPAFFDNFQVLLEKSDAP